VTCRESATHHRKAHIIGGISVNFLSLCWKT